jgi:predicted alpha/beta hydrolase family esterase
MPEASVLHFTYSDPPKVDIDWKGYVKALAAQLTTKLEEQVTVQKKAPLLFIGHGIGGLVVQEAAVQRASGLTILQEPDVGYIFLHAIFPNYQDFHRWNNDKYGQFPSIQRTRRYDFVERVLASEGGFSNGKL